MKTTCAILLLVGLGILTAAMPACNSDPTKGYTTQSQYRRGISSVAVPIWTRGKGVYRRGLEFRLTEALQKRIAFDTDYTVTVKQRADTELTGTIEQIVQRVLSFNPDTGLAREMEMTITVSFTWTDLRSGKVLLERSNFRVAGTYIPPAPLGEDFFQGSEDVVNELARRIVEQMEADW